MQRPSNRRRRRCTAVALLLALAHPAAAQRVLGVGEDATVLPRGTIRLATPITWTAYNERYGPDGTLEPIGAPFSFDALDAEALPLLLPLRRDLRTLAAQPTASVSLGATRADIQARIATTALVVDFGLSSRLMLTGRLPYTHTRSEVTFEANPRGSTTANIGVNPALGFASARTANQTLINAVSGAATQLSQRLAGCTTNPGDPVCADRPRAEALVTEARAFALGVARIYGNGSDTARGAVFVPIAGSSLQSSIEQRVASLNTAFRGFLGDAGVGTWNTPFAAQNPVTSGEVQELVQQGLGAAPIATIDRSHIGDAEVGLKLLVLDASPRRDAAPLTPDGTGLRLAVGALVRFGTGQADTPSDFTDIGTGDGQTDVEVTGAADVMIGRRFWASLVGRYGAQLADNQAVRIPGSPSSPFAPASHALRVERDLGDYMVLEVTPRYVYNDYLAFGAHWAYRRKGEDEYTGGLNVPDGTGGTTTLDASILGVDTDGSEQRVGGGITFSTLSAYERRQTGAPFELRLSHFQSVSGSGYQPKRFITQLEVRYYARLFGAPLRPPRTPRRPVPLAPPR